MRSDFGVDGYEIEGLLGAGATGETWLAREGASGNHVALQRIRPRDAQAAEQIRRLVERLDALARPHLRRIRELLPYGEEFVLVLDHVEGGTLEQLLLVRGILDPGEVVTMASTVAGALAAAHERGLVHGAVTPETILFTAEGTPLIADVGLGQLVRSPDGTPPNPYADPAEPSESTPSPAGDVYGLAGVCYTALTGLTPRAGEPHRPIHQVSPGVPPGLAHAIEAGLQRAWDMRPHIGQFAALLDAACPRVPVRLPDGKPAPEPSPPEYGPAPSTTTAPAPAYSPAPPFGPPPARESGQSGQSGQERPPQNAGPRRPEQSPPPPPRQGSGQTPPTPPPARQGGEEESHEREPSRTPQLAMVGGALLLVVIIIVGVVVWRINASSTPDTTKTTQPTRTATPTPRPSVSLDPVAAQWMKTFKTFDDRRTKAFAERQPNLLTTLYAPESQAYNENRQYMRLLAQRDARRVLGLKRPISTLRTVTKAPNRIVFEAERQEQSYTVVMDSGQQFRCPGGPVKKVRIEVVPLKGTTAWRISREWQVGGPTTAEVQVCQRVTPTG
ncbi:serine/threonine protein kinase [Actinopolymorpha alba]|uniref:serine/threonine protein kinase n=1 Tax=Actinopolymorpha alba TaxID=533267 RepID=UPI00036DAA88|nr:serine/threonine-protein kinase [Actinopolymorpha alba]